MKSNLLIKLFVFSLTIIFHLTAQGQTSTFKKVLPEDVDMSSKRLEVLTKTFQTYVDSAKIPGAVILIARQGKISYFETFGYSDIEKNIPMKENSIFRIASQTKAIISVAIMALLEDGKLVITDPVGKYLPEFNQTTVAIAKKDGSYEIVKAKRPITIRDLLTHTAGVGYGEGIAKDRWEQAGIQGWYFSSRNEPIRNTVSKMAEMPFDAHPGEKFVYGYSTDILGALIEEVTGEPLDLFLQKRILDPLEMNDTHFYLPLTKRDRLTTVYSFSSKILEKAPDSGTAIGQGEYINGPGKSYSGGAGYLSTAMDYASFLQMMLNKGKWNGQQIISRKSVELMTSDHLGNEKYNWEQGVGFGLGFSIVNDMGKKGELGSKGEYGWGGAYHSTYWVDPVEELVVVYFTQIIPAENLDDHEKLRALIYQSLD